MRSVRLAFFVFALLHGVLYAVVMPPWQAPDEVAHFEYSHLLAALGRPISLADDSIPLEQAILQSLAQFHAWTFRNGDATPDPLPTRLSQTPFGYSRTLNRFSLAYLVYALAAWPFLSRSIVVQLLAMRLVSVVLGAVVVVLAFEMARLAAPRQLGFAMAVAGFVLFLPQHAYITSSVSDGNLAELGATGCIFCLVWMWQRGLHWPQALACLACAGVAIASKATGYFLAPLLVVAGPALVLRALPPAAGRPRLSWRRAGLGLLAVAGLSVGLVSAVALMPPLAYVRLMLRSNLGKLRHFGPYLAGLNAGGRFSSALAGTFDSFWAVFGWMAAWLPAWVYGVLLAATALAVAGLAWRLRRRPGESVPERSPLALLGLAAVLAASALVAWFVASPNGLDYFQGRYLFGAIVPIAILLVAGWLAWLPARYQAPGAWAVVALMALLDAAAIFTLAWPYFYRAGLA